jgi:hypothetical protein
LDTDSIPPEGVHPEMSVTGKRLAVSPPPLWLSFPHRRAQLATIRATRKTKALRMVLILISNFV